MNRHCAHRRDGGADLAGLADRYGWPGAAFAIRRQGALRYIAIRARRQACLEGVLHILVLAVEDHEALIPPSKGDGVVVVAPPIAHLRRSRGIVAEARHP